MTQALYKEAPSQGILFNGQADGRWDMSPFWACLAYARFQTLCNDTTTVNVLRDDFSEHLLLFPFDLWVDRYDQRLMPC